MRTTPPTSEVRAKIKADSAGRPARVYARELTNGTIQTTKVENTLSDREIDILYSEVTVYGIGGISKNAGVTYPDGSSVNISVTADTTPGVSMIVDAGKWLVEQASGVASKWF